MTHPQITSTLADVRNRIYAGQHTENSELTTLIETFPVFMLAKHEQFLALAAQHSDTCVEPGALAETLNAEITGDETHTWHPLLTTEYEITAQGGNFDDIRIHSTHVVTHSDFPPAHVAEIATSFSMLQPWEAWSQFFTPLHDVGAHPIVNEAGELDEKFTGMLFRGNHPVARIAPLYFHIEKTLGVIKNTRNIAIQFEPTLYAAACAAYEQAGLIQPDETLNPNDILIASLGTTISGFLIDDMPQHLRNYITTA